MIQAPAQLGPGAFFGYGGVALIQHFRDGIVAEEGQMQGVLTRITAASAYSVLH